MSANLYEKNGITAMAYAGQRPWHGQGQVIEATDDRDTITQKAGFDFSLVPETAGFMNERGTFIPVEGKVILRRSDTGAPVSVVGDRFNVHQPKQILDFFFDYAKTFNMQLETAGVLGRGERYWALAKTQVSAPLSDKKNDVAMLYALLATACDGSMRTIATPTGTRVVCANTWRVAMNDASEQKTGLRQSHRAAFSNEKAAKGLGFNIEAHSHAFMEQAETIRFLRSINVDDETAKQWYKDLLRPKSEGATETDREPRGLDAILESYRYAPGAEPGTARGLFEGATHFIDHVRGTDDDKRMNSAVFGQGADLKARAWENVKALIAA